VLAAPSAAVALGTEPYVMVIGTDRRLQRRPVRVGVVQGDWREVVDGIVEGEQLVASSPLDLAAGDSVRVVEQTIGGS
jgi:multidrug efflux pump subunit AcrA (membrane-fusion protein)